MKIELPTATRNIASGIPSPRDRAQIFIDHNGFKYIKCRYCQNTVTLKDDDPKEES